MRDQNPARRFLGQLILQLARRNDIEDLAERMAKCVAPWH